MGRGDLNSPAARVPLRAPAGARLAYSAGAPHAALRGVRFPSHREVCTIMGPDELGGRGWRETLPGVLLALMIVLAAGRGLWAGLPAWPAGLAGWGAALCLWPRLRAGQRLQAAGLLGLGGAGMAWAALHGAPVSPGAALSRNHALLGMLAAVSFLRLVGLPAGRDDERPPRGPGAYLRTLLGVHLFGAVINISTVMIFGDRLARGGALTPQQALLISRGFSSAAFWSPFFAAMATVLTYAPGARLPVLVAVGLPCAAFGLLLSWREALRADPRRLAGFRGYPLRAESLRVPLLLGAGVFGAHALLPGLAVLTVITLLAPLVTGLLLLQRRGAVQALRLMGGHVRLRLPEMSGELVLFLAAGVLAVGLGDVLASMHGWVPYARLTGMTATLTLVVMVALAAAGVHPVISISTVAALIQATHPDPDLMAVMFLMSWAIGVAGSPLSGLHLVLQGRYGIGGWNFTRWNVRYVCIMLAVAALALNAYAQLG